MLTILALFLYRNPTIFDGRFNFKKYSERIKKHEKNKNENYIEHLTYIVKKVTWSEALSDDGIERKITIHTLAHLNPEEQKQIDKKLKIQHELNELFKQPK